MGGYRNTVPLTKCELLSQTSVTAEDEVDSGDLGLSVSYRGFPIYTETKDLCKQTDCPVKKGPVKVDLEQPFPIITPPVSPVEPLCLSLSISIVLPSCSTNAQVYLAAVSCEKSGLEAHRLTAVCPSVGMSWCMMVVFGGAGGFRCSSASVHLTDWRD